MRAHFSEHPEEVARCAAMVRIIDVNQATLRLYEAASKEELVAGLQKLFIPDSYRLFADELVSLAAGRNVFTGETSTQTLKGEGKQVMLTWLLVPGYEDTLSKVLVSVIDISDLRRTEQERLEMERRLLHSQKLESLGVLAGGIAHDFNNLLMALLGNMELALEDLSPVSSARPRVEQAVVAAKRAADLTRQMLAYSGKGYFDIRALDLSELVEENAHMLRTAVPRNVTFSMQLRKDLAPIEADAGQIQQVVMNLIVNASEAIGDQPGIVTLSTGVQECDAAYLSRSLVEVKPAPGRFVWLEVSDTGGGMDQRTIQRIFDPFFTTKLTGRGLGMSAVHGIVRGRQGAILIDTRVGKGTSVRVLFPAAQHLIAQRVQTTALEAEPAAAAPATLLSGTVLVVDDEPMVCDLAAATLTGAGLQVLTAADGMQAVELFRQHADEIGCVLLDLTMPKMDGVTTLELLCQIRPDVRVILSSGYDEQEATRRFAGRGLAGFLQKPYQLRELRAELRRVLEAAA